MFDIDDNGLTLVEIGEKSLEDVKVCIFHPLCPLYCPVNSSSAYLHYSQAATGASFRVADNLIPMKSV